MKTCDELREECRELYRCDRSAQVLWHYTNVEGAIGIIEMSCLRLGCHAFMNDPAEGLRSPELVTACWQAAVDKTASHPKFDLKRLRDTDDVFGDFADYKQHPEPTFLVSMTVEPDSLSQWTRYGSDGSGIALCFQVDPSAFEKFLPAQEWSYGPLLYKILYDFQDSGARQSGLPSAAIDMAHFRDSLTALFRSFLLEASDPSEIENGLYLVAHDLKPVIKQAAYHEEKEWRIAAHTVVESTSLYEVRATRFGVGPVMKLPFGAGLQLQEIRLGPKLSKDNRWSMEWLCRKHGVKAKISQSAFS